ncbi:MAG: Nif3-like dinuclear metal center hexameric protein [Caldilineales bacterium]|nr:Nif3-like dinuclear metal center hexameric protein [Caldilineales bacterium]MCW5859530.1 Nif3-like dinuclear metal center hexameric protein [Caldilineales bacterium]
MNRSDLVSYLDALLNLAAIPDYGPQGLQVEGREEVHTLAVGVDAAHPTIDGALAAGADLLLVHHGIFWGEARRIAGAFGHKVRKLIRADLNLYAAHLALDLHPTLGNNAELCRLLGLHPTGSYFAYKGVDVGLIAEPVAATTFAELAAAFAGALQPPLLVDASGPERVRRVAVCSGDASRSLEEAGRLGCDLLITGERDYTMAHVAAELGMNVIYGGHYATETLGVQALARHLHEQFGLAWVFVDVPIAQ